MIPHTTTAAGPGGEDYTTGEGLRALLARLHAEGPGAWRTDPTAAKLMEYAAEKYAALARKHGLDPWEAAGAAFDRRWVSGRGCGRSRAPPTSSNTSCTRPRTGSSTRARGQRRAASGTGRGGCTWRA